MSMKVAMMILVIACLGLLSWMSPVMGQGSCSWMQIASNPPGSIYDMAVFDDGAGPVLVAASSNGVYQFSCPGATISLTHTQVGGVVHFANANLTPQSQYYNIFSLDTCSGGPGTGPHLGMCLTTMPNYMFILDQLQAPLGTPLFHFTAQDSYTIWGGYQIPPITVDGIAFDFTGGVIGAVSPVTRIVVQ